MVASALKAQKETIFNDEAKAFIVSRLNAQNKAAMNAAAATNAATVSGTTAKASNDGNSSNADNASGAATASGAAIASPSAKTKSILKEILRKAKE